MSLEADLQDLSIAFAMLCDGHGLTYTQGLNACEELSEMIYDIADTRYTYAPQEPDE